ncbi:hypothetical protein [Photorhabdus heterorhabditis]|uniref:hypothetical protein n=1 Tax=Photorhabdus heterorhabditis TaxID=880156 RepID=UPI001BD6A4DF|nr:hypothetical protein [Photorhabdus heterorhabditis]
MLIAAIHAARVNKYGEFGLVGFFFVYAILPILHQRDNVSTSIPINAAAFFLDNDIPFSLLPLVINCIFIPFVNPEHTEKARLSALTFSSDAHS